MKPIADRVVLDLGGRELLFAESYDVQISALTQPAAFGVRTAPGDRLAEALAVCGIGAPFKLYIGDDPSRSGSTVLQLSGAVDGFNVEVAEGSGSTLTIQGRDALAPVHDAFVTSEQSFSEITFRELTEAVLTKALGGRAFTLTTDAAALRKAATGSPMPKGTKTADERVDETVGGADAVPGPKTQQKTLRTKLGQQWFSGVLKPELDRAGLFLRATPDGNFLLAQLDANQVPLYRIVRRRGASSVLRTSWRNSANGRFSRCDVHGRRGGGATARTNILGSCIDAELEAAGLVKVLSLDDDRAKTIAQAEFLARRKIAEARRAGWSLTYVVSGHTTPTLEGGSAVWSPDTVVEVDDDELGLRGPFWIESVRFARDPRTTTTLVLMRPEDVIFGEELPEAAAPSRAGGGATASTLSGAKRLVWGFFS